MIRKPIIKLLTRLLIYSLVFMVTLGVTGLFFIGKSFREDRLKPDLEQSLSDFFQRPLTIGKLNWRINPLLILSASQVTVWEKDGTVIAQSPAVHLDVDLFRLLQKSINIKNISIYKPQVGLRYRKDGSINIVNQFQDIKRHNQRKIASPQNDALKIVVDQVKLDHASVSIIDETGHFPNRFPPLIADAIFDITASTSTTLLKVKGAIENKTQRFGNVLVQGEIGDDTWVKILISRLDWDLFKIDFPRFNGVSGNMDLECTYSSQNDVRSWTGKVTTNRLVIQRVSHNPSIEAAFALSSSSFSISDLKISSPHTKGEGSAIFSSTAPKTGSLSIQFYELAIEDTLDWWAALRSTAPPPPSLGTLPSPENQWKIDGEIKAQNISYKTIFIEKLFTPFRLSGSTVSLSNFTAESSTSRVTGQLKWWWDAQNSTTPTQFDSIWETRNVDISHLSTLTPLETFAYGSLDSQGALRGSLSLSDLHNWSGWSQGVIRNGALAEAPSIINLLGKLNIKTLLTQKSKTQGDLLPFEIAGATITMKNGVVNAEDPVYLSNKTLSMAFTGRWDLIHDTVQGRFILYFPSFISEVANVLPGIRQLLLGDKKSIMPFSVKISGPRTNPTYEIEPIRDLSKTVGHTLVNILKFPRNMLSIFKKTEK